MIVGFININGYDSNVYNGMRERSKQVGTIDPPSLRLDDVDMIEVKGEMECNVVYGCPCFKKKDGIIPRPEYGLYVSDYIWRRCNYTCKYCLAGSPSFTRTNKFYIPVDQRIAWLTTLTAFGKRYFYRMFGGEPTIYPGFDRLVEWLDADPNCVTCNISTNAHLGEKIRPVLGRRKFTFYVGVHPQDPLFDWANIKSTITLIYEANHPIILIGVATEQSQGVLYRYSKELEQELGIGITLYDDIFSNRSHNEK